jgi:hypothetical protein
MAAAAAGLGDAAGLAAGLAAGDGFAAALGDAAGLAAGLLAGAAVGFAAAVVGAGAEVGAAGAAVWHALRARTSTAGAQKRKRNRLASVIDWNRSTLLKNGGLPIVILTMDSQPTAPSSDLNELRDDVGPVHAVLAHLHLSWETGEETDAALVHATKNLLILEGAAPSFKLPAPGSKVKITGETEHVEGRLAEHGRAGRFLISVGERPVRRALRLRVSIPGTVRAPALETPREVEIADLTTGGARVRGVELPVGSHVTLDFVPPGRTESVTVRALVAHGTHGASKPWIGVAFRLVALRGGR